MIKEEIIPGIKLYCGDCRRILPSLDLADAAVITDPPWDQARGIAGADDPRGLFAAVAPAIARARRAVIQLGINTDPCFLAPLSALMPYAQTCWLGYAVPSYAGRVLRNADLAYCYGQHIPSRPGPRVIPAQTMSSGKRSGERMFARRYGRNRREQAIEQWLDGCAHPMARHLNHALWLVRWWSEPNEVVVDPFCGSGTTLVAAALLGRRAIGIEIDPRYHALARQRVEEALRQADLFHATGAA
jgi:site-specific DNA-methyltransferase (adenine-specific)